MLLLYNRSYMDSRVVWQMLQSFLSNLSLTKSPALPWFQNFRKINFKKYKGILYKLSFCCCKFWPQIQLGYSSSSSVKNALNIRSSKTPLRPNLEMLNTKRVIWFISNMSLKYTDMAKKYQRLQRRFFVFIFQNTKKYCLH